VCASRVGVDDVGLRAGGLALPIDRRGVDRVDRHAGIQQSGDEQAAIGLGDASQVRGLRGHVANAAQEGDERGYPVGGVGIGKVVRADLHVRSAPFLSVERVDQIHKGVGYSCGVDEHMEVASVDVPIGPSRLLGAVGYFRVR